MKIAPKTSSEIKKMREGGKKLAEVRENLKKSIKKGVSADDIEQEATALIKEKNGKPSFKTVPGYSWSTCINVNNGVVHGIPHKEVIFEEGDLVSVDVGMYFQGFHTDTSFSLILGKKSSKFLDGGRNALKRGISKARVGNRIYDISNAIEKALSEQNLTPIKSLVGHGIGRDLHEFPHIPCFTNLDRKESPEIPIGATFAIEVMYSEGSDKLILEDDNWTVSTKDGSMAGLFEETVAVLKDGPEILTRA